MIDTRSATAPTVGQVMTATGPNGANWQTPAVGGSGVSGVTTVDFGAYPGATDASVAVVGQASILAGSAVEASIQATATADHTADEHWVEEIEVVAGNIVAGVGFTIYARTASKTRLSGQWTVAWRWS